MWKKATDDKEKNLEYTVKLKVQKIECKSINIVWKQDETTTKSMNALHRFLKKAQKARFAWAKFQNIQPKFRQGIQFNRNVEIITYYYIVVNSLYYKELTTLGLKINCSVPKL